MEPVPVTPMVPVTVPVEISTVYDGENFPEPNEISSSEGAESDEEPQIVPTTVEGITKKRSSKSNSIGDFLGINGQLTTLDTQSAIQIKINKS